MENYSTQPMLMSEAETKAMLDAEPKARIRIAKDKNNANYVTERVFVNGYPYMVEVGEWVDVPQTIADILAEKGVI